MGQVTISGTTYDVYGTADGLKAYLAGKLGPLAYDTAESADKSKALVSATRWIDREKWQGSMTDEVTPQPLEWPRTGVTDCDGNAVDSASVPDDIINATYELAEILLGDPAAADGANTGSNTKRVKAGSAEVEFFRPGSADGSGGGGTLFPVPAQKLVACFLEGAGGAFSTPYAGGTSQPSSFCTDDFDRNKGFA